MGNESHLSDLGNYYSQARLQPRKRHRGLRPAICTAARDSQGDASVERASILEDTPPTGRNAQHQWCGSTFCKQRHCQFRNKSTECRWGLRRESRDWHDEHDRWYAVYIEYLYKYEQPNYRLHSRCLGRQLL